MNIPRCVAYGTLSTLMLLVGASGARSETAQSPEPPWIRVRNETGQRWVAIDETGNALAIDAVESGSAIPLARLEARRHRCEPGGALLELAPSTEDATVLALRITEPTEAGATREKRIPLSANAPNVVTIDAAFGATIRPGIPTSISLGASEIAAGESLSGEIAVNAADLPVTLQLRAEPTGVVEVPDEVSAVDGIARIGITATRPSEDRQVLIRASAGGTERTASLLVQRQPWRLVALTTRRHRATGGADMVGTVHVTGMSEDTEPVLLRLVSSSALVRVPETVEVRWAQRLARADFPIETEPVDRPISVEIGAKGASGERTWTIRLEPLLAAALVIEPPQLRPGGSATATLTLSDVAPSTTEILVQSGPPGALAVPDRVTVEKGQRTVSFAVGRSLSGAAGPWLSVAPAAFPGLELRKSLDAAESPP